MSGHPAKLERARLALVRSQPFFGSLALYLPPVELPDSHPAWRGNPTMATDGRSLYYSRTYVERTPERKLLGAVAHEAMHPALGHHARRQGRDLREWNIAADLALNPILIAAGFELPDGALFDKQFAGMSAEAIYAARERARQQQQQQQQQRQGGAGQQQQSGGAGQQAGQPGGAPQPGGAGKSGQQPGAAGQSSAGSGAGQPAGGGQPGQGGGPGQPSAGNGGGATAGSPHGSPGAPGGTMPGGAGAPSNGQPSGAGRATKPGGADPGRCGAVWDAAPDHDPAGLEQAARDWEARVRQAVAVAKAAGAGKLPGGVAELVRQLNTPRIDWRAVLRRFVDESAARDYSWCRPNRRHLPAGRILPGHVPLRPTHIVAMVDTSGSMTAEELSAFSAELAGMMDDGAADRVTVAYADTKVHGSAEFEPGDTVALSAKGRGGTDFRQPFQWAAEHVPDASAIIYMTDADVEQWGEEPAAPVLWLVTGDPRQAARRAARAPFGESIILAE